MSIPEHIRQLRLHIGHELLLVPSVTAFVRNLTGDVLVVQLSQEGRWTLPGGLLELGESPVDALVREAREECGLEVEPVSVLGVFGGPDGFRRTYSNGDQIECSEVLFECKVVGGSLAFSDNEVIATDFRAPNDLHGWAYPVPVYDLCDAADRKRTVVKLGGVSLLL